MTSALQSMIASTYVRDIDASRSFYELLGFQQERSGKAATSAWAAMHQDGQYVLLASTRPPLDVPRLPLLFYFYYADVDAVVSVLGAAGVQTAHVGYPPHALGGEVKILDPDGNTVLVGQRERSPSQPPAEETEVSPHFSLLREAAALVSATGGTTAVCQVSDFRGVRCGKKAEVKIADTAGDSAWACLSHADEILVTVPGAFIANQEGQGLVAFLSGRR